MDGVRTDPSTRAVRIICAILVVAMLYFARDILIPASLAVLLTFLLHPLVLGLVRLRLNRAIAVAITVILATSVAGGGPFSAATGHPFSPLKHTQLKGNRTPHNPPAS